MGGWWIIVLRMRNKLLWFTGGHQSKLRFNNTQCPSYSFHPAA